MLGGELFELALDFAIERQAVNRDLRFGSRFRLSQMRRKLRKLAAHSGHHLFLGAIRFCFGNNAGLNGCVEHAVARDFGARRIAIRTARFGRLRNGDKQRGFTNREGLRLLAEVSERGSPRAFDVAAHGGKTQVNAQDVVFAETLFKLQRPHDLAEFSGARALVTAFEQTGGLHRQRRAARYDATLADQLQAGACEGLNIDTGVLIKAPVFERHEDFQVTRINSVGFDWQTPAAIRRRKRA